MPLELFSKEGLSYIASVIGIPLYMDRITASSTRLFYAKVCIEIDVKYEIPSIVKVMLKDGSISHVKVEVPWNPHKCKKCKVFGHNEKSCLRSEKQAWTSKADLNNQPSKVVDQPFTGVGLVIENSSAPDAEFFNVVNSAVTSDPVMIASSVFDLMTVVKQNVAEQLDVVVATPQRSGYIPFKNISNSPCHVVHVPTSLKGKPWMIMSLRMR